MEQCVVVGVDAGGSSTCSVAIETAGSVIAVAEAGPANPHVVGFDASIALLVSVIRRVLVDVRSPPRAVTVALSGADEAVMVYNVKRKLRDWCDGIWGDADVPLHVLHDAVAPVGLAPELLLGSPCCVVIAGTGSVAAAFDIVLCHAGSGGEHAGMQDGPDGNNADDRDNAVVRGSHAAIVMRKRAGGRGPRIGDGGSAHFISTAIISRALRVVDDIVSSSSDVASPPRREHPTISHSSSGAASGPALKQDAHQVLVHTATALGLQHIDAPLSEPAIAQVVAALHTTAITRTTIAALARPFSTLVCEGNVIARVAFADAGRALARLVRAVVGSCGRDGGGDGVSVMATGGVFVGAWGDVAAFRDAFMAGVAKKSRQGVRKVFVVRRKRAGAVGAARVGAVVEGLDGATLKELAASYWQCVDIKRGAVCRDVDGQGL